MRDLRYFWFADAEIERIPLAPARSNRSKQGGFDLYLMDGTKGDRLWQIVKETGKPFDIGPGYPKPLKRTEIALLNSGIDTDETINPYEVRMERFVDLDLQDAVSGQRPLRRIKVAEVKRHQLGVILEGPEEYEDQSIWPERERKTVPRPGIRTTGPGPIGWSA